jgi:serine/threonine protein kinase
MNQHSSQPARCERCEREVAPDALFCPMCGAPRVRSDDSLIGALIADRYLVHQRLGHGGSGNIYFAEHVTLRKRVAIKVLHHELSRDDLAIERFRREATTVSQIDNEHIVEVLDFGRLTDGRLFLAMEYLEGETLQDALAQQGTLPIPQVVDILTQLGEALMEAHAMGYIHRDLRPRNVFLARRRGRDGYVKLLDFGLAKLVEREGEAASTSLGMTFGDPHYMSPEQAHGEPVDRRGDIYSLGVIAFQMLTGRPPFLGEKVFDVLTAHLENPPPVPSSMRREVPAWLDAVVLRMLAKNPDDRFVTVYRLVEALKDGLVNGHIMTDDLARKTLTVPPPAPAPRSREHTAQLAVPPVVTPGPPPPMPTPMPPPAAAGKHPGVSQPGDAAGLSGAWYADGEAMDGKDGRAATERVASKKNGTSRPSWSQDVVYDDSAAKRRKLLVGGVVGGVVILVIVLVFALSGGKKPAAALAVPSDASVPDATAIAVVVPDAAAEAAPDAAVEAAAPAPTPAPKKPAAAASVAPKMAPLVSSGTPAKVDKADVAKLRNITPTRPAPTKPAPLGPTAPNLAPGPSTPEPESPEGADAAQAEFYVKLGRTALAKGDAAGAATNFNKAREFDAKNPDAIAGLGEVALAQGLFQDATVHLEAAARLAPKSSRILTLLGQSYMGTSRPKKAADAFKRALKIDPGNDAARRGYEEASRAGGD